MRTDREATKQYNRDRAAKLYTEYQARRDAVMQSLGGCCYLCRKPAGINFHLHHIEYHPTESDYDRSGRSLYVRLKRVAEAESHPERFKLLCAEHHRLVEGLRCQTGAVDRERLAELVLLP